MCVRLLFDLGEEPKSESSLSLHSMPLKFYKSCADSLLLFLYIYAIFAFFVVFLQFWLIFLSFFVCECVCDCVCVNGERLRSQAKSHKTHSSNPQSHSSWVIYLTLSVMDKYYVAPRALDGLAPTTTTIATTWKRQKTQTTRERERG